MPPVLAAEIPLIVVLTEIKAQLQEEGGHNPPGRHTWVHSLVIGEAVPLDPIGYLLYKATLPSLGDLAALPKHSNKHREAAQ